MARKVLISFVGTGALLQNKPNGGNAREYRTATYHIDGEEYTKSFIADAIASHYKETHNQGIGNIILIGTVKSMWEEVYMTFCNKNGIPVDDDYYVQLGEHCSASNNASPLELPQKGTLETALGGSSHVVLVKYGLTEEELEYNMSAILGIEQYLENGDELYVDITHSFRSLPMLLMNTLIYMQNVSRKNIKIRHIYYGMLDVTRELGYTPVVDLKKILDVNDWISGAYSFMEFGNAYKISNLLNKDATKSASTVLRDFSNSKNINNIYALQTQVRRLNSVNNLPDIANVTVTPVINDFKSRLGTFRSNSEFQYKLAKWHRDKHNYSSAYLTLTEAVITYICEECRLNDSDKNERDIAKDILMNNRDYAALKRIYLDVNDIRKTIAHAVAHTQSNNHIIDTLNRSIEQLDSILC